MRDTHRPLQPNQKHYFSGPQCIFMANYSHFGLLITIFVPICLEISGNSEIEYLEGDRILATLLGFQKELKE